jgi:hypothetical protein
MHILDFFSGLCIACCFSDHDVCSCCFGLLQSKLEQVVIEVNFDSSKAGYLALKLAAEIAGKHSSKEDLHCA